MRAFSTVFIIALLFEALSSCTTLIYVPRQYPPEIVTGTKPATAVYVNNFDYTNRDIVPEKRKGTYMLAVHSFLKGFLNSVLPSDSLEMVVGDTLRRETDAGMLTTLLPIGTIADYCGRYNASLMIVLDSVNIGFDTKADYIESVSYINFYSRSYFLYGEFFMSAYAPNGDVINRSSVARDIMYSWRMGITSEAIIYPSIANAARKIGRVAQPAGLEYVKKFRTTTENVQRKVYTGARFNNSIEMMKSGRWNDAVAELEKISASSGGSAAKHARANLEVAREGLEQDKR